MPLLPALRLHLDAMFTQPHTAYPALWNGITANVLFLASTDEVFQGELARANTYAIIHQANAFVGMVAGDAIVVDGINYLVLQIDLIDDGEACRTLLSKAN